MEKIALSAGPLQCRFGALPCSLLSPAAALMAVSSWEARLLRALKLSSRKVDGAKPLLFSCVNAVLAARVHAGIVSGPSPSDRRSSTTVREWTAMSETRKNQNALPPCCSQNHVPEM